MLDELKHISLPDLVDLLSEYTATYTKLLAENSRSDEFITAREMIRLIQGEIQLRKTREQAPVPGEQTGLQDSNEQSGSSFL